MGREVKRVPLDFDHPLDKVWYGYQITFCHEEYQGGCERCREFARIMGIPPKLYEYIQNENAQLAREIESALPVELSRVEQPALVRSFVKDNFAAVGMCADFAPHDKGDGNPHAHPPQAVPSERAVRERDDRPGGIPLGL